ncbi:MAG: glutamate-1-semialdehyde 2,1-aminomutase [Candidatus Bathyarchaeota archaeon]|jgi:glutamate-1-semialdehyde 2,1-aminomutase|nr:glutamate-1-semialdehyde 2,1-aminomutase [Candidatus Bathyarchaeota archaeon]
MKEMKNSKKLFEEAKKLTPGGVHSALRFFDPCPIFISKAKGSRIYDVDGNQYIDYHLAFGPVILGHAHSSISAAVKKQLNEGVIYGLCNELEVKVAKKIVAHVPSAQMVRFCNTGTEATYHAIRLARAYTGKSKIVKFEGAYHGWHDIVSFSSNPTLKEAGPKKCPTPVPDTAGITEDTAKQVIIVPFNDQEAVEKAIKRHHNEIAALITEPILHGSATCITPKEDFLKFLREITREYDIVLIFDEVVTGFRHHLGGAQKIFNVTPDLTTFAKAMANGFPVAAVCGRKDMMEHFRPTGNVDYGGTFNGNPISMAATLATIEELEKNEVHKHLFKLGEEVRNQLNRIVAKLKFEAQMVGFGSVFQILFTKKEIVNYRDTLSSKNELFMKFQKEMMKRGVFILPKPNKRCHISAAHTAEDINYTIEKAEEVLKMLK